MSIDNNEIVVTLDMKRILAISLLAVISIYTIYSYSVALFAFVANDNTVLFRVTNFDTYTTGDVQQDSFTLGTNVRVKASIEKATAYTNPSYSVISDPTTCKVSVIVYYDDSGVVNPIGFYTGTVTLQPGISEDIQLDVKVPNDGVTGANYYAKVFVWDDYLPGGGEDIIDHGNSVAVIKNFTGVAS